MTKKLFFLSVLFIAHTSFSQNIHAGAIENPSTLSPYSAKVLKVYMAKFGSYMSGINIEKEQNKKPDWEVIDITVKEMSTTLEEMKKSDKTNAYKPYTDALTKQLLIIKEKSEKKNSKIYDDFDNLMQTCFTCHALHRDRDFLSAQAQ